LGGINLSFFMKKTIYLFLVIFLFLPLIATASVVINEICWMGTKISSNNEWIELYAQEQTNLDGWILESTDGTPDMSLQGAIPAQGYFLLERTDDSTVPNISANQIYTGALSNSGEYLQLKDDQQNLIDEVDCGEQWLVGDNSTKQTMARINNQWQTSQNPGGTPKQKNVGAEQTTDPESSPQVQSDSQTENHPPIADAGNDIIGFVDQAITVNASRSYDPDNDSLTYEWNLGDGEIKQQAVVEHKYAYPGEFIVSLTVSDDLASGTDTIKIDIYPRQITINEFIPNPEGKDAEEEWIEIYNNLDQAVDLSGWFLDDEEGGSNSFKIPENSLIPSKGYLVFSREITNIALNNDGDQVRLLLPDKNLFQKISYKQTEQGKSLANSPQGFVWSMPTPGFYNSSGIEQEKANSLNSAPSAETSQPEQSTPLKNFDSEQNYYNLANLEKSTGGNSKVILILVTVAAIIFAIILGILKIKKHSDS